MPFYAVSFSYNGIPSETYGLLISEIDGSGVSKSMGSGSVDIYNQKIYRRAVPFFFGASPSEVLKFTMSAHATSELTAVDFELIQKWLFSSRSYKRLQIFQPDLDTVYFNAIFNSPEIERVGNNIVGFTAEVQTNAPYAFMFPKTTTYTFTSPVVDSTKIFINSSDDSENYLYPSLVITMNTFGGNVSITNVGDSNRVSSFTGLAAGEVITINSDTQIISSSTSLYRLSAFNKKFLRLLPGKNTLRIQGAVASIAMTTTFVSRRIGG
jgi:phage-related protein